MRRAAIVAAVLTLPSLGLGWQTDDYFHRAALTDETARLADARRSFAEMFAFIKDGLVDRADAMDKGDLPWWSSPNLKLAFFRPVTGLAHWIDYALWPDTPWIMHAQSIAWYAVTVALAAVFFRRIAPSATVAGFAALIYAIDDGHGLPAVWLANRNATIAACFGIVALLAYDRWRRDGWRGGALLTPVMLLVALLANEGAVAVVAYLVAYAALMDPRRGWRRFAALVPSLAVAVGWWGMYRLAGYGASGSGVYIDPASDPVRFASAVARRGPVMLNGLLAIPPADIHILLSQPLVVALWGVSLVVIVLIGIAALRLVRTDARLRFAVWGMLLSLVPPCATFASDRLMMFAGLGGSVLIAQLIVSASRTVRNRAAGATRRRIAGLLGGGLVLVHLVVAPVNFVQASRNIRRFAAPVRRAAAGLPTDKGIEKQRLVLVNSPSAFITLMAGMYSASRQNAIADKTLVLASGSYGARVTRTNDRTLLVTVDGGWLMQPGTWPRDRGDTFAWFGGQYAFQVFDLLFRDAQPFEPGQHLDLSDVRIEIMSITNDGRPASVRFQFAAPLQGGRYRWVCWRDDRYAPWNLPAVGLTVVLPPPRVTLSSQ